MTHQELVKEIVERMLTVEKRDPYFVIGYLSSYLGDIASNAPKKYSSQLHRDLVVNLSMRGEQV